MKEITMTIKEVSEVLGVSRQTIYRAMEDAGISDLSKNGQVTYLDESQVTAIKTNLRKTSEIAKEAITDLEAAEMLLKSAEHFKTRFEQEHEARIEAERRLSEAEPKAAFTDLAMQSKDVLSMNDAAKVLKLGYGNITLYRKLRGMRVLMDDNVPYQKYIARGYFLVDEWPLSIGDNITMKRVTKVTQKGLEWLSKRLGEQDDSLDEQGRQSASQLSALRA